MIKFKFSDSMLLELALKQLKTDKVQFQKQMYEQLQLNKPQFIEKTTTQLKKLSPDGVTPLHTTELLYSTPTHLIKTTQYGRIKNVLNRPKSKPSNLTKEITKTLNTKTPTVTIKPAKRRIIK